MASLNKVELIGRLGQDPEIRHTASGTAVASFSVATDERFTDRAGDLQKRTEWHKVTAWGKLAEICGQYLKKGRQVYIEGRIQNEKWESNGQKRFDYKVVASRMLMLGSKPEDAETAAAGEPPPPSEDVPF